jgi:Na+-transporting methylmalonyl-CoA/oxaloacetate decarboxylase gamma subunit
MNCPDKKDDRHGMVIGGLIVLGLGIVFLLANLEIIPDFGTMWPLILVVIGIALLIGAVVKREKKEEAEQKDRFQPPE